MLLKLFLCTDLNCFQDATRRAKMVNIKVSVATVHLIYQ